MEKLKDISAWTHDHRFETGGEGRAERRTMIVVALTITMMIVEIVVGSFSNSMALLADGFHMSTHAAALGIAAFAYRHAREHSDDRRYTFGTGKIGSLAAFASAIILGMVALLMVWESGHRLLTRQVIAFDEALLVATVGLAVNLLSALILGGGHGHDHAHGHHAHHHAHHDGQAEHQDHNLRAAYIHVLADAFTSVLAIVALLFGMLWDWWWLDPLMGIVGAGVISSWALGLLKSSGKTLLDINDDPDLENEVRAAVALDGETRITDLHLWQVGPGHWSLILSLVTGTSQEPSYYKELLACVHELSHITIEIHHDDGALTRA